MLIVNAVVHTMDGPVIERGWLRTNGRKIEALGPMESLMPSDEERVDLEGGHLLPGLIDAHCHVGMWEDSLGFEGDDGNEDTDPVTPHLRGLDAVNPADRAFREALEAGVTTVVTGPGSANPIGGQMLAMHTYGRRADDMVLAAPLAMKMALGENPKTVYHGKGKAPVTRMATAAIIREALFRAREYDRKQTRAAKGDGESPGYDIRLEALVPVVRGQLPVHFHAHRGDDIFTALRIMQEFGLHGVLIHGTEGYLYAGELSRSGIAVVTGPNLTDRSKPELRNLSFEGPGLLQREGVQVALCTDHPVVPLKYLMLSAGLAVQSGMEPERALEALTIIPARMLNLDARIGSLTPGKEADLVAYQGPPLSLEARVSLVVVQGERVL